MAASIVILVIGFLLMVGGFLVGITLLLPVGLLLVIGGVIGAIVAGTRKADPAHPGGAVGYTDRGEPIYPIVGYTADGAAVTADRAVGYRAHNPQTNGLAVTTLILAFVFPLLAIPFGHVARGQIRRTGEQGGGLALAGLLISYIWLALVILVVVILLIQTRA